MFDTHRDDENFLKLLLKPIVMSNAWHSHGLMLDTYKGDENFLKLLLKLTVISNA